MTTAAPFSTQQALFKAYDIRGESVLFTSQFIFALAHSFAQYYHQKYVDAVVVGHDTRIQSATIAHAIACALNNIGINVHWLGLVSTPLMVFWANRFGGSGIIATASHSPKHISGIKWLTHHQSPSRDDITWLYQHLPTNTIKPITETLHQLSATQKTTIAQEYAIALHTIIKNSTQGKLAKTLIIDCLDGASSVVAQAVFYPWVDKLIILNQRTDGQFSKGNPDPAEPNRLHELSQAVLSHQADIGLAFDGDGDRLAVVDSTGQVLGFDELLCLLAIASQQHNPQKLKKILFDVKCLHTLPKIISKLSHGKITAIMTKTGSSHLRRQVVSDHACFAGELSGHFIFNDGQFTGHDDGIYAAIRLLLWLQTQDKPLHTIYQHMPKPIATPDLYTNLPSSMVRHATPHEFVTRLSDFIKHTTQNNPKLVAQTIDGIRLDYYPKGKHATAFGLIRASNTSNSLTLRFAGDDMTDFDAIVDTFINFLYTFAKQTNIAFEKPLLDFLPIVKQNIYQSLTLTTP